MMEDLAQLQKIVADKAATLEFQKTIVRNIKADLANISGRVHRLDVLVSENEVQLSQIQDQLDIAIEELRSM